MNMFEMHSCGKRHEVEATCNCSNLQSGTLFKIRAKSKMCCRQSAVHTIQASKMLVFPRKFIKHANIVVVTGIGGTISL